VPANRPSIVLVLPHAIGTSRHGVSHSQRHGAVDVAGILHAFAEAIADQQQVSSRREFLFRRPALSRPAERIGHHKATTGTQSCASAH
jgi:hypothetical protein